MILFRLSRFFRQVICAAEVVTRFARRHDDSQKDHSLLAAIAQTLARPNDGSLRLPWRLFLIEA